MDGLEVGEVGSGLKDFSVANNPLFVHYKCGTLGYPVHVKYEIIVEGAVGGGDGLIEIAEKGEVEVLVFLVFGKGEDGIYADAEDLGIGLVVEGDIIAGAAKLLCAGTSEGLGEEKEEDILSCVVAQGYFLFVGVEKGKVWCGLADLDGTGAHVKYLGAKVVDFRISGRGIGDSRVRGNRYRKGKVRNRRGLR